MSVREKYMHILFNFNKMLPTYLNRKCSNWNTNRWSIHGENFKWIPVAEMCLQGGTKWPSWIVVCKKIKLTVALISCKLFIISQFQLDMMKSMICDILLFFTMGWIQAIIQSMLSISHVSSVQKNLACSLWMFDINIDWCDLLPQGCQLVSWWLTGTVHFLK